MIRSSSKILFARILTSGITFFGIIYFARELEPELLGMYFLFESLVGVTGIIANFGIRGAVEKRISGRELPNGGVIVTSISILTINSIFLSVFFFLFYNRINEYVGHDVALFVPLAILLSQLAKLTLNILRGYLKVEETAVVEAVRPVVWFITGGLLIRHGYGLNGLLIGYFSGYLVMLLLGLIRCPLELGWPSRSIVSSLLSYSKFAVVNSVGGQIFSWTDVLLIGFFLTQSAVAAYEIAWRFAGTVMVFSGAIGTAVFPEISKLNTDNKRHEMKSKINNSAAATYIITIPAFFGALVLSEDILTFLFGTEYLMASIPLVILVGAKVFEGARNIYGRALHGINKPRLASMSTVLSMSVNIVLNIILVWAYGLVGAALATSTAYVVKTHIDIRFLKKYVEIYHPRRIIAGCTFAAGAMAVILFTGKQMFHLDSTLALMLYVVAGAVVYILLLLMIDSMRKEVYEIVVEMRR